MTNKQIQKLIEKKIEQWHIGECPHDSIDKNCKLLMDWNGVFDIQDLKDFTKQLIDDVISYDNSQKIIKRIEEEIR